MKRVRITWLSIAAIVAVAACGEDVDTAVASAAADQPAQVAQVPGVGSPFEISYELVGTPIVGSPVTLNLKIASAFGPTPVDIRYDITDSTALALHEAQPKSLRAEMTMNESFVEDRVTVIPQREGRVYLNVEAGVATEEGRISTSMAIPIHVEALQPSLLDQDEAEAQDDAEPPPP